MTVCKISLDQVFAQTYISGDNSKQFSFGGYFSEGEEYAGIVVNQIRQYPQGISSFVKEIENKKIENRIRNLVTAFVDSLKYTGFLEMEFKMDAKNEITYLLDVNPRPWGWVSILGAKYKKFHLILSESKNNKLKNEDSKLSWANPIRDIVSIFKNQQNSRNKNDKFLRSYTTNNIVLDIFDEKDFKPTLSIIKVGIMKILKRIR